MFMDFSFLYFQIYAYNNGGMFALTDSIISNGNNYGLYVGYSQSPGLNIFLDNVKFTQLQRPLFVDLTNGYEEDDIVIVKR